VRVRERIPVPLVRLSCSSAHTPLATSLRGISPQPVGTPSRQSVVSPLGSLGSLLMATFRLGPAERWLSCYVGDPLGPLLESYSMERSLSGRCETKRNNRPVHRKGSHRRVGSVSHRDPGAGVVLADCPGSASGRALRPSPHRLTPSSPRGGPSDNPLSHKRCLSFCELGELSAQEMEPRPRRARW